MKRLPLLSLLLAVASLVACSQSLPPPPRAAAWIGNETGRLFVRVLAVEPLRDLELTAPDGRVFLPQRLIAAESGIPVTETWRPGFGLGGVAGSSGDFGAGIGISLPIARSTPSNAYRSNQAEFEMPAEALASYRARPQDWKLLLRFGQNTASLPAPPLNP